MTKSDQLRALREARAKKSDGGEPIGATRQPSPGTPGPSDTNSASAAEGNSSPSSRRHKREPEPALVGAKSSCPEITDNSPKRGPGRPKITGPRPWEAAGMSRRSWYRKIRKEVTTQYAKTLAYLAKDD